jgi:prepilin-type processing-associated H-X9-DG protein
MQVQMGKQTRDEIPGQDRLYSGRITRGDRHYRRVGSLVVSCLHPGPTQGMADDLCDSYAANVALNPRDYPILPPPLDARGSGVFGKDLSPGVKVASVVRPAECIAIVEIKHIPDSLFVVDIATDFDRGFQVYSDCLFTGHSGLTNYLFVDGHVKALRPTETYQGDAVNYWYRDATPLGPEARTTLAKAEAGHD